MGILDLKNTVTEKESTEKNDCRFPLGNLGGQKEVELHF